MKLDWLVAIFAGGERFDEAIDEDGTAVCDVFVDDVLEVEVEVGKVLVDLKGKF